MKKFFLFAFTCLLVGCQQLENRRIIRLGHALDTNHSVHKAMVKMGEELYRISSGTMEIKIYPNDGKFYNLKNGKKFLKKYIKVYSYKEKNSNNCCLL